MRKFTVLLAGICALAAQTSQARDCSQQEWTSALQGNLSVATVEMYAGVQLAVTDLCIDVGNIRPNSGATLTVGNGDVDDPVRNVTWLKPIKGYESQCLPTDSETCQWQNAYREINTNYRVSVVDLGTESREEVCQKDYSLPPCTQ